jgi:hypothetical protein
VPTRKKRNEKNAEKKAQKLERIENERLEALRVEKEKEREPLEKERLEKERVEAEKKTHIQMTNSPGPTIKKVITTTSNLEPPPGYVFSTLPQQQAQQVLAFANHPPPHPPQQSPFGLFGRNPAMVDAAILNVPQPTGFINPISPVGYPAPGLGYPASPVGYPTTTFANPQWTKEYTQAAIHDIQTKQAALALQKQQLESLYSPPPSVVATQEFQMVNPSLNTKVFGDVFGSFGGGVGGEEERDFAYNGVNGSKKIW